jgi:hypothetical protein
MLPEALVLFACFNSTGCTETSNEYFRRNPDIKHKIDKTAENVRQYVGPSIVDTVGPFLFVAAGGTGVIHLHEHFNLQMKKDSATLIFSWSY